MSTGGAATRQQMIEYLSLLRRAVFFLFSDAEGDTAATVRAGKALKRWKVLNTHIITYIYYIYNTSL